MQPSLSRGLTKCDSKQIKIPYELKQHWQPHTEDGPFMVPAKGKQKLSSYGLIENLQEVGGRQREERQTDFAGEPTMTNLSLSAGSPLASLTHSAQLVE